MESIDIFSEIFLQFRIHFGMYSYLQNEFVKDRNDILYGNGNRMEIWVFHAVVHDYENVGADIFKLYIFHILLWAKLISKECNICKSFVLHMLTHGLRQKNTLYQSFLCYFHLRDPFCKISFHICQIRSLSRIIQKPISIYITDIILAKSGLAKHWRLLTWWIINCLNTFVTSMKCMFVVNILQFSYTFLDLIQDLSDE